MLDSLKPSSSVPKNNEIDNFRWLPGKRTHLVVMTGRFGRVSDSYVEKKAAPRRAVVVGL